MRAERFRQTADGKLEDEPLVYFFWRATHHGVPMEERLPAVELAFYMDLLAATAKAVSEEHTLNCKGGAFWNNLGTMSEMQLPVFVLLNVLLWSYHSKESTSYHPELGERFKRAVLKKAAELVKLSKDPKTAPKPNPPYKVLFLGKPELDSRGFLPLDTFLRLGMTAAAEQRVKDAKVLDAIYAQWEKESPQSGFDVFLEMMAESAPDLLEDQLINLYSQATSGDDPDKVEMGLIDTELRRLGVTIKRKAGVTSLDDGIATMDDLKVAVKTESIASTLFGAKKHVSPSASPESVPKEEEAVAPGPKTAPAAPGRSRWGKLRTASLATGKMKGLLHELELLREAG